MLQVAKLKQSSAQDKAARKAEKKAGKEAKKEKKRAASQMESALAANGVGPQSFDINASARHHAYSSQPPRHGNSDHRRIREVDSQHGSDRHARDSSHVEYKDDSSHAHKQRRLHSPERRSDREHDRHRSSDRAHRDDHSDRHNTREHYRHRDDDARPDAVRVASHHHSNGAANGHQHDGERRDGKGHDGKVHDGKGGTQYGLSWGATAPEELQGRDR